MAIREELLCVSANGKRIIFDPIGSHAATHFNDALGLRALAEELFMGMNLEGAVVEKYVDMGRTIGNTDVVTVDDSDDIVYAMRMSRDEQGYVPFTKSRSAQPCSLISVSLIERDSETYELSSIWIGSYESPPFPQMINATPESIPYWNKRVFVWGSQAIIPGTEHTECPW